MTGLRWRGFILGESEWEKGQGRLASGSVRREESETDRQTDKEMGDGKSPFKGEGNKCAQEVCS